MLEDTQDGVGNLEASETGLVRSTFEEPFLGGPVFRLNDPMCASQATELLRAQTATLCMARIPVQDGAAARELEKAGFRYVETFVTFEKALQREMVDTHSMDANGKEGQDAFRLRVARDEDCAACSKIAATALIYDRFRADPAIETEAAQAIKAAWISNAIRGRADVVWVAEASDGAVMGFCAVLKKGDRGIIDLIAVSPVAQGRGIGRWLMDASENSCTGNTSVMRVGTQASNTVSQGFYQALGYSECQRQTTWHWVP